MGMVWLALAFNLKACGASNPMTRSTEYTESTEINNKEKGVVFDLFAFFRVFRAFRGLRFCFYVLALLPLFSVACFAQISPSQVLVLFNADWTDDHFLTDPGQDSKEIAEYYVRMHTDPQTGEKPYLLGLSCDHGIKLLDEAKHLNQHHLQEKSSDNKSGVVLKKKNWLTDTEKINDQLRDSRLVEFAFPGGPDKWNRETLFMELIPDKGSDITLVENGLIEYAGKISGSSGKDWAIRFNGKNIVPGRFTVKASCEDNSGERHEWKADYVDLDGVEYSRTGDDGVRDDLHFYEDVELPVKKFLEDPKNARPDGSLLKDHILNIVVCYGLPRTAIAPYGVARGITDKLNNFGNIISFGQRLQLLYYDFEQVQGTQPKPYKYAGKNPFTDFLLRAPQAWPLYGDKANPFVHPLLYKKKKGDLDALPDALEFNVGNRNRFPNRHLFFVSRIDATDPMQARALIDRAVYASKYGGPQMGILPDVEYPKSNKRVGKLNRAAAGGWIWDKGYRHLHDGGQGMHRLDFLYLQPNEGFLNDQPVFLPGGIAGTVISHNGWKNKEMVQQLSQGVTATAGAAKVYRGAPHIHNKSWWDDEILYPALFKGKALGAAWLMNQVHLGWITAFVGDPLYMLPVEPVVHNEKTPDFDSTQARVVMGKDKAVWLSVELGNSATKEQVAQLRMLSLGGGEVVSPTFDSRPFVKLGDAGKVCGTRWQLELMSPFGEKWLEEVTVDCAQ